MIFKLGKKKKNKKRKAPLLFSYHRTAASMQRCSGVDTRAVMQEIFVGVLALKVGFLVLKG